jgi:hypothetical protein
VEGLEALHFVIHLPSHGRGTTLVHALDFFKAVALLLQDRLFKKKGSSE